ncbi:asparaginase, partial [Kaarinaea lacus]
KTGAEGVLAAAIPAKGLGIAIKIADGGNRARSVVLLAILDHLGILSAEEKNQLKVHIAPSIENSRGLTVGEIRPASSWLSKLNKN